MSDTRILKCLTTSLIPGKAGAFRVGGLFCRIQVINSEVTQAIKADERGLFDSRWRVFRASLFRDATRLARVLTPG